MSRNFYYGHNKVTGQTTDVYTLHYYFRCLWYEVGRQLLKSQQATVTSPYLTSPTPPIHSQRTAPTPGTSCATLITISVWVL